MPKSPVADCKNKGEIEGREEKEEETLIRGSKF